MNYYPFHLGDYAAHTAHLEPMEDLAYRRMLDLYYRTEKALPKDVSAIARLIRMVDCAATVRDVLNEFFTLSDDGWHSKRADDELTEMKTKQEQQATKDEHEADRLRRFRARRAEMFDALRAVGVVPAWDVAMKELQRLFDANCNAPEARMGALSEMDSQRLSLPTPTPTPTPVEEKQPTVVGASRAPKTKGSRLPADWVLPQEWHVWVVSEFPNWPMSHLNAISRDFADYWQAKAGKDAIKADWFATWRRWCRKAQESVRAPPMSFRERDAAIAAARVHEMTGGLVSAKPPGHRADALQEVFDAIPIQLAR